MTPTPEAEAIALLLGASVFDMEPTDHARQFTHKGHRYAASRSEIWDLHNERDAVLLGKRAGLFIFALN